MEHLAVWQFLASQLSEAQGLMLTQAYVLYQEANLSLVIYSPSHYKIARSLARRGLLKNTNGDYYVPTPAGQAVVLELHR